MRSSFVIAAVLLCVWAAPACGGNWGHWRGDGGNGASLDARPPVEWSDTENVKWKVAIPGRGSGSPVIWDERVFVVTAVKRQEQDATSSEGSGARRTRARRGTVPTATFDFKLLCFDRSTGELQWQQTAATATPHQGTHETHGYASASPCTDGERVVAHFGSRGSYCYTMDGELVWQRDDFGKMTTLNSFGEGSSPTLEGEMVLVPWDHEGPSSLYALDKRSGETIWKVDRDEPSCWATPLVVGREGQRQVIMNGQNSARAYDLETGEELWRCSGQTVRPVASPVASGELVYVGSGFQGSYFGAFYLDGQGDIEGTGSVAWEIHRDAPDISSPLFSNGRIYFHKGKTAMLSCVDAATGEPHYLARRIDGIRLTYASPIAAGGHVYLTGRNGTTVVIKDAAELEIVATNSVGETVDATPAPVDDELFIRGEEHLFCIAR